MVKSMRSFDFHVIALLKAVAGRPELSSMLAQTVHPESSDSGCLQQAMRAVSSSSSTAPRH